MDNPEIRNRMLDEGCLDEDALFMDGYDDCIMGVASQFGRPPVVAYDFDKVIQSLMEQGMTWEEAVEFHEYNQAGAWMGEYTPAFVRRLD